MKKKNKKEKFLIHKLIICIIYLILITILLACSYHFFKEQENIVPWSEVQSVDDYTYIDIYKMSEKFAYYKDTNIGIHFVIEKEDTGLWHTYLIAINEEDYSKYKDIIDYTYERTKEEPKSIRAYGYPVIVPDEVKKLAIKNIPSFVPKENEVKITEDNYNEYLTNSYLDTTKEEIDRTSLKLSISLGLLIVMIILLMRTILIKDKNRKSKGVSLWNFKK